MTKTLVGGSLALLTYFGISNGRLQADEEDAAADAIPLDDLAGSAALWGMTAADFDGRFVRPKSDDDESDVPVEIRRVIESSGDDEDDSADGEAESPEKVFEWLSGAQNAARFQGEQTSFSIEGGRFKSKRKKGKIGDVLVGETLVRFDGGNIKQVEFSIYNRGDDDIISKSDFGERLKAVSDLVTARTGARMETPGSRSSSAARAERRIWRGEEAYYQLEYSFQTDYRPDDFSSRVYSFYPEFIILKVAPPSAGSVLAGAAASQRVSRGDLKDNVVKRDNGDVLITTVPMVDQGQKGYCAVASAERVLRYFGLEVDQHEMAQIAESTASRGTNSEFMVEALEKAAGRLSVRVQTEYDLDDRDFDRILRSYNRIAKKTGDTEEIIIRRGYILNPVYLLHEGHAETLRSARADGSQYDKFKRDIAERIDVGVPLLWSLYLGIFPEEDIPQPSGGHMRLIIGYNEDTDELIYSDSWGAGHEEKRMKFDEAYTMTLGLRVLIPSR